MLPTGDDELTLDNFGVGPTVVALKQSGGFTYGALINQIWGLSPDLEDSSRPDDVSQMFFHPFLIYNWPTGAGLGANFELTQNWPQSNTTLWFNPFINGVTSIGKQKVQIGAGPRFNLAAPHHCSIFIPQIKQGHPVIQDLL